MWHRMDGLWFTWVVLKCYDIWIVMKITAKELYPILDERSWSLEVITTKNLELEIVNQLVLKWIYPSRLREY